MHEPGSGRNRPVSGTALWLVGKQILDIYLLPENISACLPPSLAILLPPPCHRPMRVNGTPRGCEIVQEIRRQRFHKALSTYMHEHPESLIRVRFLACRRPPTTNRLLSPVEEGGR